MSLRPFIFTLAFILVFTAGVSLTGCIINVNAAGMPDLDHQQRELTLDSQDLQGLIAETGAGSLEIIGVEGLSQIKLVADIYSNKGSNDSKLILTLEKKANKAKLKADFEQSGFNNYSPYIDLKLQVPANLALDIDDGSGDIEVSQINDNLTVEDGSGAIKVTDVRGNIAIDDGSGNIEVANVQSAVTITDGSGNINVFNTKGLTILAAGSGDVKFNKIDGPVSME